VIEMELIRCATDDTLPVVSFPNFHLDVSWNHSTPLESTRPRRCQQKVLSKRSELEFEDEASSIVLPPTVNELECAIERPNALMNLLVDSY